MVAAFNQEKALVGAFSVITNLRMELFQALTDRLKQPSSPPDEPATFALLSDPHEVDCDDDGDGEDN